MEDVLSKEKVIFLTGAFEVLQIVSETELIKYFPRNLNHGEFALAVDRFYDVPENLPIPAFYAARAVTMKANGEDPIACEMAVAAMRRAAVEVQPKL